MLSAPTAVASARWSAAMRNFWLGFAAAFGALAVIGLVLLSGGYDVAASRPHTRPVAWVLDTTRKNSVERRSADIVPVSFTAEQVRRGFALYAQSCEHCHGAPGRAPQEWGRAMLPRPPALSTSANEWSPEQLYWMLENGIKMSGMPAFGEVYTDAQLWELVAFVARLPRLERGEYTAMEAQLRERREAQATGSAPPGG